MVGLNVYCYAFVAAISLTLFSCQDEPSNSKAQTNSESWFKPSTLKVSFYCDSVWVDSIIHIQPVVISDSSRLITPYTDTILSLMQKQIYELKKVNITVDGAARMKLTWITRLVHKSDTIKEFGLYFISRHGQIRENRRFRFNERNELIEVNDYPPASKAFVPLNKWIADTIALDE